MARQQARSQRALSVPMQHQLKVARATLKMPDAMVRIMGGMTKAQARDVIVTLTGRIPRENRRRRVVVKRRRRNADAGVYRISDLVRRKNRLPGLRKTKRSGLYSEHSAWAEVAAVAAAVKDVSTVRDMPDYVAKQLRDIERIAVGMWKQVHRGKHENPTLALVGAANPRRVRGKFLGFVDRIEYDRAVGKHRGGHFHNVSTQDAKLYGLADGSLLITRR